MDYEDRTLSCVDCGQPFIFSADDQSFHAEKGFTNEPKRCPNCRQSRRAERGGGVGQGPRECTRQSAQSAAKKLLYPFCLAAIVQCTVAIASAHEDLAQEQAGKYSVIEPRKSAAFLKMQHSFL
jgi:hypothetical protein